jgi:hypothetical protein
MTQFSWWHKQEVEATIINGKGTETGHIIVTTTGGMNGQPKQVNELLHLIWIDSYSLHVYNASIRLVAETQPYNMLCYDPSALCQNLLAEKNPEQANCFE